MNMPSFLCDEMLGHLCRYLRAAGYDTRLANNGTSDAELLRQCHAEGRYFLTQDTLVREHQAAHGITLILPHTSLDRLAAAITSTGCPMPSPAACSTTRRWWQRMQPQRHLCRRMHGGTAKHCDAARCAAGSTGAARTGSACGRSWKRCRILRADRNR